MKNEIILWLSSFVLLFILGYSKNISDKDYPITGTFGIDGNKVSYKLDKVSYDKTHYKNIIISDVRGIEAKFLLMNDDKKDEIPYSVIERGLECEIPKLQPGQKIYYKVQINYNEKVFEIPKKEFVTLTFWGNIPPTINFLYFFLLYVGLLMSIRCLLELFNNYRNLKKYIFITVTLFILLNILVFPLYITYKLGAINHFIPPFSDLINPSLLIILLLWVTGNIFIFNKINIRIVTIIVGAATILIFYYV